MSVAKLSEQLAKAGFVIEVYTTTANGNNELPVNPGVKTTVDGVSVTYFNRVTKDHSHFSPSLLKNLWIHVREFDSVHIHAWWNLVSVLSALIALLRNMPVVISPRGTLSTYSFNNKNNILKKLLHHLLGKYLLNRSFIHVTSVAEGNEIKNIIKPRGLFNISNFVNIPSFLPHQASVICEPFKLIFFSRIDEKKGLDILLKALPQIKIPYHLTIAGDGDKNYIEQLKKITSDNLSSSHISWIGFQNENKFEILSKHDLMILPSYNENFGNVVIESLSVGTPVLISEYVGLAGYVLKNNLGWVCQTTSGCVSDAVNNIAASKHNEMINIRATGPVIIRRDFEEENLVKNYISMYQEIISNGRL